MELTAMLRTDCSSKSTWLMLMLCTTAASMLVSGGHRVKEGHDYEKTTVTAALCLVQAASDIYLDYQVAVVVRDSWVAADELVSCGTFRQLAELHVITKVDNLHQQNSKLRSHIEVKSQC